MARLKDILIPHHRNEYRPHAIRGRGLLVFAVYILTFQTIYNYQQGGEFRVLGYATNVSAPALLSETNAQRAANGMAPFAGNGLLAQAAQAKANHMIANNYWSHYAPDGTSPWFFINQTGYSYERAGENLAYGFSTSAGVISGWMGSPSHRANILDSGFREVGFGIANGANFQGGENTVVVAMYGQPLAPAPAPTPTPAPAPAPAPTPAPSTIEPAPTPSEATPEPEPAPEEPEEAPQAVLEEERRDDESDSDDANSQRMLAELSANGTLIVTGPGSVLDATESRITNIDAMLAGQAHWSLYMVVGGMMSMALIFALRHMHAIRQTIVHGEHFVAGHPSLEASIVYLAIWLMLFASFGVII